MPRGLQREDMFKFSDIVEIQGHSECVTEKTFLTLMKLLKIQMTEVKQIVSEIPNTISEENVITVPGPGKKAISILSNKFCKEQIFPYLVHKGETGYNFLNL